MTAPRPHSNVHSGPNTPLLCYIKDLKQKTKRMFALGDTPIPIVKYRSILFAFSLTFPPPPPPVKNRTTLITTTSDNLNCGPPASECCKVVSLYF